MLALASWATRAKILCFTRVFLSVVEFEFYVCRSAGTTPRARRPAYSRCRRPRTRMTSATPARASGKDTTAARCRFRS